MPEQQNPEHQLEYLKELRAKYETVLADAQKSGDYTEAKKLKEELDQRLSALEAQFPKPEIKNNIEEEHNYEIELEKQFIHALKKFLENNSISPKDVFLNLTGMGTEKAVDLRAQAYTSRVNETKNINDANELMLRSYAGVDNDDAWRFRALNLDNHFVLDSVAGLDSFKAWKIRDRFGDDKSLNMLTSLTGLDSESAWALRESLQRHYSKDHLESEFLKNIAGLDSVRAWKIRDSIDLNLTDSIGSLLLEALAISLTGLDTKKSWKLRDSIISAAETLDESVHDSILNAMGQSLAGLDSERAWQIRNSLMDGEIDLVLYGTVAKSLAGLYNDDARKMRETLRKHLFASEIIESVNGDYITAIGWRTARKYQKEKK